ncbi:MAG TPA: hypothetical protein VFJ96_14425 [Gemmatimonadaceae bacterium]|jgi:hypothetical protein|nr:hypothetical protein [Gemmatimonadaceae bacterium]
MDPDVLTFAQVSAVIVMFLGSLTAIGIGAAFAIKRLKRKGNALPEADMRLEQLQQSVDAIAIEVERISEAQRFSTQLLAKRVETPALEQ